MASRLALVTGAASGIGAAIATGLAGAGWEVVVADIDAGQGADTAARLRGRFVRCDMGVAEEVERLVAEAGPALGLLVNNAGVAGPAGPLHACDPEAWSATLAVNVTGPFLAVRAAVPTLLAGGGCIVNIGAAMAMHPLPGRGPYIVSKAALTSLTEVLALELGPLGIRVNAVAPGPVRGARMDRAVANLACERELSEDEARQAVLARAPLGRPVEPDDIARAVAFLAGDGAASITGQVLAVSAGWR